MQTQRVNVERIKKSIKSDTWRLFEEVAKREGVSAEQLVMQLDEEGETPPNCQAPQSEHIQH